MREKRWKRLTKRLNLCIHPTTPSVHLSIDRYINTFPQDPLNLNENERVLMWAIVVNKRNARGAKRRRDGWIFNLDLGNSFGLIGLRSDDLRYIKTILYPVSRASSR